MPKTIVFDLDGTLIHSAPDLQAAVNVALSALGRDRLALDVITGFIGNGVEKLVARSLEATGGNSDADFDRALALFRAAYAKDMVTLTHPYPGVLACVSALSERGIMLGICTNKPDGPARQICDALGLSRHFAVVQGARPDRPKKPDPTPLLDTIAAMGGTAANSLYVGDSAVDQATAINAGVPFALFERGYLNTPLAEAEPAFRFSHWSPDLFQAV